MSTFADAAARAGCEPLLVSAWRDAALELGTGSDQPVADSVRRLAAEQVDSAAAQIQALCARSTPRLERLRQIRLALAAPPPPDTTTGAPWFAPVYFDPGQVEVRDDSVRLRLRALGNRLAAARLPLTLVVEGFADGMEDDAAARELGLSRARSVIAELRRGGLGSGCCMAVAHPAAPRPAGSAGDPRLAHRVTFSYDYREETP
jgi:outer membrane protein OmpA-like peptidoglycan-associated protein